MLYYLQSSRAAGLRLKEEWATTVPSIIWDGLNSHSAGVVLIWACRYQPLLQPWLKWKHLFYVQPSVSLLSNFFNRFLNIQEKSASLLSSAVIWCFLYIRHEFDTAVVAIFIRKPFSKIFSIPFCKKTTTKELQQHDFLLFLWLLFFQCCGIFFFLNFGYCQVCCVTLSSRAFFNICKWSKNACPTFLKKICILRIWM